MKTNDEDYVTEKCNELLSEAGVVSVPVNLELLGSLQGISRFEEMEMVEAGRLVPDSSGGYIVVVRTSDNPAKKRFTMAHEIGHTIVPNALVKEGHTDFEVGVFDIYKRIEYLCDFAASLLLMPPAIFSDYVKGMEFSFENIIETANHFNVSIEATALQFVKRNHSKRAVVVWEIAHKPTEEILLVTPSFPSMEMYRPEKKVRIKYAFGFPSKNHLPKHKSLVESNGIIEKAFEAREVSKGTQAIFFNETVGTECDCEAMMTIEGRVLSILKIK